MATGSPQPTPARQSISDRTSWTSNPAAAPGAPHPPPAPPVDLRPDQLDVEPRRDEVGVDEPGVLQEAGHRLIEPGQVPRVEDDALLVDLVVADVPGMDVPGPVLRTV